MARFRATINGERGEASRLGSAKSGIRATVNGWDLGIRVYADANGDGDVFTITATGGSNGAIRDRVLGVVTRAGNHIVFTPESMDTDEPRKERTP